MTLNEIVETVQTQFSEGPPNGWLLGWDETRCFELIHAAAAPLDTTSLVAFDYGFCNWYETRVEGDAAHHNWTLTVKLSFIVPAYCIYWTQYETSTDGFLVETAPTGYQQTEDKVRAAVERVGFFELPVEWHEVQIHGVELELSETNNVTLDKCLFQDHAA